MDDGRAVMLIFDGDCGFCTSFASWAERGWRGEARALPWQTVGDDGLRQLGLSREDAEEAAWWCDGSGRLFKGHYAIGRCLVASRGWRQLVGWLLLAPPASRIVARCYQIAVRHRYRLPGATPACRSDRNDRRPMHTRT
jgi:predicted DCC family thiol-disulfide oxidoreductase YuxK